jgi:nitrite reductase/ring-hydroxylating ferredoxin subunit
MSDPYVKICSENELLQGKAKVVEIEGNEVIVIKLNDKIHALENTCSHDGGSLGEGTVTDGHIECPRHGGWFDIETGEATRMPAIAPIRTFEVKIKEGDVFIALRQ